MPESDALSTEHFYTVYANGLDIYYEEQGEGYPLVLIHGGALTGNSWEPYLAAFTQHFRVIMPDSRGHGRTNNPTGEMSYRHMADDVAALIETLGLEKPLVCGYSDGGQVALELGMRYPTLPRALIIAGAATELSEGSLQWVESILGDLQSPEVDFERFERDNAEWAADMKATHGDPQWKALFRSVKPMWSAPLNYTAEDFAKVTAPALVLLADHDDLVPVEDACRMYRLLPHAELAIIPDSSHPALIFSRRKVAFAQTLMLDFLLRHSGSEDN